VGLRHQSLANRRFAARRRRACAWSIRYITRGWSTRNRSTSGPPRTMQRSGRVATTSAIGGSPRSTLTSPKNSPRASVARFGHDQVISQVVRALKPFRSRCVLVSKDLATIHTARTRAEYPVGWVIPAYDAHNRLKYEAFKPEYLFCDRALLPARGPLWRGPWRWAVSDVSDLDTALELANRGADFVVTRNVRSLGEAMRARAAARAAHTASMATANAVSRSEGISRADVSSRIGVDDVTHREVGPRATPPVRTDAAPRNNVDDEIYYPMPVAAEA